MSGNPVLIAIGIIFTLVILGIIFRKLVWLLLIHAIYGRYSHEFALQYKKFYIRSPFQYCFRDEFITHLLFFKDNQDKCPVIKTGKDIFFENIPFFVKYKEFIRKKGTPYCFNSYEFSHPRFTIQAVGYQEAVAGSKATIIYYFMDNLFFMGEYIFKNPKTGIKQSLLSHFADNTDLIGDQFYILNHSDRIVHYQDTGFTIDIKYLSRENETITNKLQEYIDGLTNKPKIIPEA